MKEEMKQATSIVTKALSEKYLGLPTAVEQSTTKAFWTDPDKNSGFDKGLEREAAQWCR